MASEIEANQNAHLYESPAFDSRFDIFSPCPVDVATLKEDFQEYKPLSQIRHGSPIEIQIPPAHFNYIDFSRSTLRVTFRILRNDNSPVDANDRVSVVNLAIASLFKSVDIFIGYQIFTADVGVNYFYKSICDSLVRNSASYLERMGPSLLFYKDTAHHIDTISVTPGGANLGQFERYLWTSKGAVCLEAPLFADLTEMGQYLPSGIDVKLKLYPQDADFVLMSDMPTEHYKIKLDDVAFNVQYVQPTTAVAMQHFKLLESKPALFSLPRSVLKSFSIPKGCRQWSIDTLYSTELPHELFVMMVDSRAYHGDRTMSPANFQHFDLENLTFQIEAKKAIVYQPQFDSRHFNREYIDLTRNNASTTSITYSDYDGGYSIFRICCGPDIRRAYSLALVKSQTRLKFTFKNDLKENITIITYGRFFSSFRLDKARNIYLNTP